MLVKLAHDTFPQAPRNRILVLTGSLALPRVGPLTPIAIRGKAAEHDLRQAPASSAGSIAKISNLLSRPDCDIGASYEGLRDELEPYVKDMSSRDQSGEIGKVAKEFSVYSRLTERSPYRSSMTVEEFLSLLLEVHRRLGTGANGWRKTAVGVRPDPKGNKVLYPHHRLCRTLLGSLHAFLCQHSADHPALSATVAYGAFVHAHPFEDGNGRTARTLFNLVLSSVTETNHFVPVHQISALYRSSFLIKLRRAVYNSDWQPLQSFFCDAIRLSSRLQ